MKSQDAIRSPMEASGMSQSGVTKEQTDPLACFLIGSLGIFAGKDEAIDDFVY